MEWIKCSELMPARKNPTSNLYTESIAVLFVVKDIITDPIQLGYFDYTTGFERWNTMDSYETGDYYSRDEVTYWMPLPELPK